MDSSREPSPTAAYRYCDDVLVRELPDQVLMRRPTSAPGNGVTLTVGGSGAPLLRLALTAPSAVAIDSAIVAHMGAARREEALQFLEHLVDEGYLTRG